MMTTPVAEKVMPRTRSARGVAPAIVAFAALAVIVVGGVLGAGIGTKPIAPLDVATALAHPSAIDPTSIIVWRLRIPRVLLALIVGVALGVAGVVMQALTRNPLAEPGLLGVNAGASLAVVLATSLLGVSVGTSVWFALAGAGAAALLVFRIAARTDAARLVLAGAAFSACVSAIIGTVTMRNTTVFSDYRAWVVGSFADRDSSVVGSVLPFVIIGAVLAFCVAFPLNAVALGNDQARSLGVNLALTHGAALIAIVLLSGAATAAAGPISFAGLLIPHILTLCGIADVRERTVLGGLAGAALLVVADLIGRVVIRPGELQVGIVVAIIGAPMLAWLVVRSGHSSKQEHAR